MLEMLAKMNMSQYSCAIFYIKSHNQHLVLSVMDTFPCERQKDILSVIFTLFLRLWPTLQHPGCPGSREPCKLD